MPRELRVHIDEDSNEVDVSEPTVRQNGDKFFWSAAENVSRFDIVFAKEQWPFELPWVSPIHVTTATPSKNYKIRNDVDTTKPHKYSVKNVYDILNNQVDDLDPHIIVDDGGKGGQDDRYFRGNLRKIIHEAIHEATCAINEYRAKNSADSDLKLFPSGVHSVTVEIKPNSEIHIKFG